MQINPDVTSIHRGLPSSTEESLCGEARLSRLGTSQGAEAPLLHRIRYGAPSCILDPVVGRLLLAEVYRPALGRRQAAAVVAMDEAAENFRGRVGDEVLNIE
jgi:hypothetical protein